MKIAILLYDRMTALDAVGPYEVLAQAPGNEVVFVGAQKGMVRTDTGALGLSADRSIEEVDGADVLLVPGGPGDQAVMADERILDWIRRIDRESAWTTSVCSGALILAAAGLLGGKRATTHWAVFDRLEALGALPVAERVVEDGKYLTAAGVSAGIDMALTLLMRTAGEQMAQAVQLGIEYDPDPPLSAGSPTKAPEEVVALVRGLFAAAAAKTAASG